MKNIGLALALAAALVVASRPELQDGEDYASLAREELEAAEAARILFRAWRRADPPYLIGGDPRYAAERAVRDALRVALEGVIIRSRDAWFRRAALPSELTPILFCVGDYPLTLGQLVRETSPYLQEDFERRGLPSHARLPRRLSGPPTVQSPLSTEAGVSFSYLSSSPGSPIGRGYLE